MAVICLLDPGQTVDPHLRASETVKARLVYPLPLSQVLRSLPEGRESLSVTVDVPNFVDLQNQVPMGERLLDWVAVMSPLSPEQIADPHLRASETAKAPLADHSLPDSVRNPPRQ